MTTQIKNTVRSIKIHNHMHGDYWYWIAEKNGKFRSKSAWNHIRTKHPELHWTSIIWDSKCAPKILICALLAKLNMLHTKDRFSKWNDTIDECYVLCKTQT